MVDLLSLDVVIFLTGTLAAAFVNGLAGFMYISTQPWCTPIRMRQTCIMGTGIKFGLLGVG